MVVVRIVGVVLILWNMVFVVDLLGLDLHVVIAVKMKAKMLYRRDVHLLMTKLLMMRLLPAKLLMMMLLMSSTAFKVSIDRASRV